MNRRHALTIAIINAALLAAVVSSCANAGPASPSSTVDPSPTSLVAPEGDPPPTGTRTGPVGWPPQADLTGFEVVGRSAGGRPLIATTVGSGEVRIYVIGGIHGDERTGIETSRLLLADIRRTAPDNVTLRWLVDANPDGSAANVRDNANGVDINRNWPTAHFPSEAHGLEPLSEPETQALLSELEAFEPDLIVAMHSAREGPFVNFDGPGEALAHSFAVGASGQRTWEVVAEVDWPTPGSLGTHFGRELDVPVITVEGNRWDDPAAVAPELQRGLNALLESVTSDRQDQAPACLDHRVGNACTDLTRRVNEVISEGVIGGTSGFLLKEAGGLVEAARWADFPTYPASSIKVIHFLHLLQSNNGTPASLPETPIPVHESTCNATGSTTLVSITDLTERMLIESDNRATTALQNWIGLDELNRTANEAGMIDTRIHHGFGCGGPANDPANTSTIADLIALYDGVATGLLLDEQARVFFMESLLDITATVFAELETEPAPDVRIVAKAGWYGRNLSIAGVAETPDGTFIFGAYTDKAQGIRTGFAIERVVAELLRSHIVLAG